MTLRRPFAALALLVAGALADLRGEVLIWNGRVLVGRGERDDGATERAWRRRSRAPGAVASVR
jgi:hypothetical protein